MNRAQHTIPSPPQIISGQGNDAAAGALTPHGTQLATARGVDLLVDEEPEGGAAQGGRAPAQLLAAADEDSGSGGARCARALVGRQWACGLQGLSGVGCRCCETAWLLLARTSRFAWLC